MKKYWFLISTLLSTSYFCLAIDDSLIVKQKKLNPYFIFDNSSSIVNSQNVSIFNASSGFSINKKNKIGFGISSISEVFIEEQSINNNTLNDIRFQFRYITLCYERKLYKNFRWEVSLPLCIGYGNAIVNQRNHVTGNFLSRRTRPTEVTTINLRVEYKIRPWIGMDFGLGYRFLITREEKAKELLKAPFLLYGLVFPLDYWWCFLVNKEKKQEITSDFFKARDKKRAQTFLQKK